jgi:dUTP pyrophosphatase
MEIRIKKLHELAIVPKYQRHGDAGFDLHACLDTDVCIQPHEVLVVDTGLAFEVPASHEMQVRSRSGLAAKHSLFVLNSPGTIDSQYRGPCKVILFNLGKNPILIKHGERIAQGVINRVESANFVVSDSLSETDRGTGGLGSTGV